MAIDFLIFALLLLSFVINFLALAAFWITPGLRTAANRFTINLLIINLIGCLILAPTLFLNNKSNAITLSILGATSSRSGSLTGSTVSTGSNLASEDSFEFLSKPGNHQMTIRHNGKLVEQEGIILQRNITSNSNTPNNSNGNNDEMTSQQQPNTIGYFYKCNSTHCLELSIAENSNTIVITEIEEDHEAAVSTELPYKEAMPKIPILATRCWSIDMAAALGALAVLLVVGDTWCAVTDPLRYHSRISGVKTWVFIALTWAIGILFGALSAFRVLDFETDTVLTKQQHFATTYLSWSSTSSIFGMVYACLYFIVIILLPFGFVCGMYWRIFSEARENGLRMRQNGSSPLLQSALNLNHQQHSAPTLQQYTNSICVQRNSISSSGSSHGGGHVGGLQMQIDQRKNSPACLRRDSAAKVLLPTISDDGVSDDADSSSGHLVVVPEQHNSLADGNHNILLTLQTASGEIKRNYSARQLPLLGTSSQDFRDSEALQSVRQVHSSPNLQKYTQLRQDSLTEDSCSPHLLGHDESHNQPLPTNHHHHLQRHQHFCSTGHQRPHSHPPQLRHSHVLQIPSIHASPKSLSYMSSLRHRLSNASSLFKYRDESRAARISILVVIMFLVSYLPYGFLVLLQSRITAANFESSSQLAIFMILLANLGSAFIFAYRNKRVRRGVKRLFGFEKPCRERSLQRQSTSSVRGSTFLRQSNAQTVTKANANIQRSGSRVSTYSTNSCKYLTPQSSLVSNANGGVGNGNNAQAATPVHQPCLRPNSSCSTIINFQLTKPMDNGVTTQEANKNQTNECKSKGSSNGSSNGNSNYMHIPTDSPRQVARPKLQRGITIVEQPQITGHKFKAKRSGFFKFFFRNSKQLSCTAATTATATTTMTATTTTTKVITPKDAIAPADV